MITYESLKIMRQKIEVGVRFQLFREAIGKDRVELSKEIGCIPGHLQRVENGEIAPNFNYMPILINKYGLNANLLFLDTSEDSRFEEKSIQEQLKESCKHRSIPVSEEYEELFELMQVPAVRDSVFFKLQETKRYLKNEIAEFFNTKKAGTKKA
ncbi:MAG: helix-turn-helix domain-containing protein [bacterium]|nr:helix-turn-helix domain-containing protein [bacterium]